MQPFEVIILFGDERGVIQALGPFPVQLGVDSIGLGAIQVRERCVQRGIGGDRVGLSRLHGGATGIDVRRGLQAVGEAGLLYEFLVRTRELPAAIDLVESLPDVQFVLDHIGKPPIADGACDEWADCITRLAAHPNVACKLSGLVGEAKPGAITADFQPYADLILESFGTDRVMFGSDWPVCVPYRSYEGVYELAMELLHGLSTSELDAVFGLNAVSVYGLA